MTKKKLTAKQEMFCKEFLIDLNATQAAIRAGYSEDTARQIGTENLSKPNIQETIQELMAERSRKVEITADDVLKDIIDTRAAAAKSDKLSDRIRANELLGKHLKLFTDKVEHSGKQTMEVVTGINAAPNSKNKGEDGV